MLRIGTVSDTEAIYLECHAERSEASRVLTADSISFLLLKGLLVFNISTRDASLRSA